MSFESKVVIITGSSSAIGTATALKFAKEGAYVILAARNQTKLNNVKKMCDKFGKKALVMALDISIEEKAKTLINNTFAYFGKVDTLVINTESAADVDILSESFMEDYDRIMNVNLRSAVNVTRVAIPSLIKSKGNIVNVSSVGARTNIGVHGEIPYCISKAGLNQFTRSIATKMAPYGVRVNSVSPGPVKTDILMDSAMDNFSQETIASSTLLNRVSEPEEIADIVLYLASDKARSITGSDFVIDNGAMLKS